MSGTLEDQRSAANIYTSLSSYVITASLGVIAAQAALAVFVLDKRDHLFWFYFWMIAGVIASVVSVILGGKGIAAIASGGFAGLWTLKPKHDYFNYQAILCLLGVIFLLLSLFCGTTKAEHPEGCPKLSAGGNDQRIAPTLATDMEPCVISDFPDAEHRLQSNLIGLKQRPTGCFEILTERLKRNPVGFVLIVGRVDRRALLPKAQRAYGSNFNLAYMRAMSIRKALLDACTESTGKTTPARAESDLAARIVILSAGASDIESVTGDPDDRSVAVIPYWMVLKSSVETPK